MVDAFLGKKYKLASSENFDEYMKAVGVGLVTRKVGGTATSTTWLTKDGDTYTLHTESTFKNNTVSFKLGVETDEETIDGRKVKSTFTVEGNKLIQSQKGEHNSTLTREFSDAELKGIYVSGGVTCTRVFKAI